MKLFRLLSLLLLCLAGSGGQASEAVDISQKPVSVPAQPWQIGYYQGGDYHDYYDYLRVTVEGLVELGWIEPLTLPDFPERDTAAIWRWLADNARSSYLVFRQENFFDARWDQNRRRELRGALLSRLNHSQDLDLMLAMGTWAGQDLASNVHRVPTVVLSTSDPVSAGVIDSLQDSGFDHVFASYDPGLYPQQVQLFHALIGFKKLGVPYEDSLNGRSYAGMDLIEQAAQELDFEIVPCHTQSDVAEQVIAERSVVQCFNELAPQVDAIYVTTQGGVNFRTTPQLVEIANQHGVPTFSQNGEAEVRLGYLLSLARTHGLLPEGRFIAGNIGRILNGAAPRALKQVFSGSSSVVLNMKTAEKIGLYLDADLLAAADKMFWQIESSDQ